MKQRESINDLKKTNGLLNREIERLEKVNKNCNNIIAEKEKEVKEYKKHSVIMMCVIVVLLMFIAYLG